MSFLIGSGALICPTAFVESACSQPPRRTRPRVMITRFEIRTKPKPFTGIQILEDLQAISALLDLDVPENSAMDSLLAARYVWRAALRYSKSEQIVCVCVAESRNQAYVIAPPGIELPFVIATRAEELYLWITAQRAA